MFTELQRIANVLKIKGREDISLCLSIQSEIKRLVNENSKLNFTNTMLKQQNENLRLKLKSAKKETDRIDMEQLIKDSYIKIKKEVDKVNKENDKLHSENKYLMSQVKKLKELRQVNIERR